MKPLTGSQRKYLRGLAHGLSPLVQVGKGGVTETLKASLQEQLATHELVKVKFIGFKEEKEELSKELEKASSSDCAGIIGNIAIFYRPHRDPAKRKIVLPGAKK